MSLIETVLSLQTVPRKQEEEYENTSDFLEWFYYNIYRERGFDYYPILYRVTQDTEYNNIREQCKNLMNITYTKNMNTETIINNHNNMKQWLLNALNSYTE